MRIDTKLLVLSTALLLTACGGSSKGGGASSPEDYREAKEFYHASQNFKNNPTPENIKKVRESMQKLRNMGQCSESQYKQMTEALDMAETVQKSKSMHAATVRSSNTNPATELLFFLQRMKEWKINPTPENLRKVRESTEKLRSMGAFLDDDYAKMIAAFEAADQSQKNKTSRVEELSSEEGRPVPSRQFNMASTASSRRAGPSNGKVDLRAIDGEKHSISLPVFVKLTGDMKSEINGSALWKVGNMMFGASHVSADKLSYLKSGSQKETNFVATFMAEKAFAELQFGTMSAENAYNANWSGTQQFAAVGYDFDSGVTPFVEVAARQLTKDTLDARNEVYGFAGVSVDVSATKNDFFNHDTLLTAKGGVKSFKSQNEFVSSLTLENSLNFNSGVSFKTNVNFSSESDTSFKVSVGFSQ